MSFFVNARAIREWAQSMTARSMLPHVIRRLVTATLKSQDIHKIDFPAYESVQRPGFDGQVNCSDGNAWVPGGESVWELSVESNVGGKANDDYDVRSRKTPEHVRRVTTFVCLTARHWRAKAEWSEEKRNLNEWKDVRALDADDIEQWTETGPFGFNVWFGRQIGTRPSGVDDIAERWDAISRLSSPPLVPKVFLAGRDQSIKKVEDWLIGQASKLGIACRSPNEVVDFFCAAVAVMREDLREAAESRAVIVTSFDGWVAIRDATTPAVLVIEPSVSLPAQELVRAVSNGHHVLVAEEPAFPVADRSTELERASEFELQQALEASGFTPVHAEQLARSAGGSLAILKYRLAPSHLERPAWSQNVSPEVLTACLLLGGWANSSADQDAFSQIARRPFAECETQLQLMSSAREPLVLHAAGNWRLISKDHAWSLFQNHVTPVALRIFEKLAVQILADDDPRYQLPEDERFFANISGHVPMYSGTIKRHVAETLAFLGAFGSMLQAAASIDVTSSVDRVVSTVLPSTCTWHRWASIGDKLPLLAGASPRTFLNAVRHDLDKQDSALVTLLHEEEGTPLGRCNHAGLLWALETLAWSKSFFPEVIKFLLNLASRDAPKTTWGNRPSTTLCEILSDWMPQTTATVDERIQALDLMIHTDCAASWPILLKLLPIPSGGISNPTHKPYWRAWANEWEKGATYAESAAFITATAERVIQQAQNVERWRQIFENLSRFPWEVHDQLLTALEAFCNTDISDPSRRILSEELSKQINRHRHFVDSGWSLPPETVDRLDEALGRLKPHDLAFRHAWLFDDWPDRYFERGGDHSSNEAALEAARLNAMNEILEERAFAGVVALLEQAKSPRVVGFVLAKSTEDLFATNVIPQYLGGTSRETNFVSGFIWARYYPDRWEWVDEYLRRCESAIAKANLLRSLRFSPSVWNRAEEAGSDVFRIYWETCHAFNHELEVADVEMAAHNLMAHDRPIDTLDMLSTALHQKRALSSEILFASLELLLRLHMEKRRDQCRLDTHDIQEVIEALQGRIDIESDRLIRIEWHFIRLLDRQTGHSPRALHKRLSSSASFFNEVLSCLYRPKADEAQQDQKDEPSEEKRFMAEHAYYLLHDWDLAPGTNESGSVNEADLREWCDASRQIAREAGRLDVCDSHIGTLFAKCRSQDPDGKWPCHAVRRVIAEINSESLNSGMVIGIRNGRGAVFRSKGGEQERTLSQEFRNKADGIRFESPLIAEILESVADSYDREARSWDERERWRSG